MVFLIVLLGCDLARSAVGRRWIESNALKKQIPVSERVDFGFHRFVYDDRCSAETARLFKLRGPAWSGLSGKRFPPVRKTFQGLLDFFPRAVLKSYFRKGTKW
jgi:hypothetical protein